MTRKESGKNFNRFNFQGLEAYRQTLPESQRYEKFFFGFEWDIVKARFLIQQTIRRLEVLHVPSAVRELGLDKPKLVSIRTEGDEVVMKMSTDLDFYVDPTQAMSDEIDTSVPVIVAHIQVDEREPATLLIDGFKRLYKAWQEDQETITCYVLTPEEEKLCRG
jgi:hypothetical protein